MPEIRSNGFAPIGAYGALGDGRTVALVCRDGSVDWMSVPTIDAPPVFAAILDPGTGGSFELRPDVPHTVRGRRYLPDTAVLETAFETDSGRVTVLDSLNRGRQTPLPWTELARVVSCEGGAVPMRWRIAPGDRFGNARPWAYERDRATLFRLGEQTLAVVTDGSQLEVEAEAVGGRFVAEPGRRHLVALVATDGEPVLVPAAEEIVARVEETAETWRHWRRGLGYEGPGAELVARSALTLKLLIETASGAIAAAPTTSLPEQVGGKRNFDYRFAWVRDASFTLDAMSRLGLKTELHAALSWLLQAVARTAPDVHVFYTLSGEPAAGSVDRVTALRGYRGSEPVEVGNDAASQRQLGAYGDLFDAVAHYLDAGGQLDPGTGRMLASLAERVCDIWSKPDAGIWELGDYQHYTISKISCWVALDRAVRFAEHGQLPAWQSGRWRACAEQVRRWVEEHCWSPEKRSLVMHPETDDIDASVLLAARTGFWKGDDPRLHSTIDAVRRELAAEGPLLYRYGKMRGREGAFAACTFWLVEALARAGRHQEAREVFSGMAGYCNDLGLISEEIDPATADLLGNFPQGLSHLALIGAATALEPSA